MECLKKTDPETSDSVAFLDCHNMTINQAKSLDDEQLATFAHPLLHHVRGVRDGVRQSPTDWAICQLSPSCVTPVPRGHGSTDILAELDLSKVFFCTTQFGQMLQNISTLRLKTKSTSIWWECLFRWHTLDNDQRQCSKNGTKEKT